LKNNFKKIFQKIFKKKISKKFDIKNLKKPTSTHFTKIKPSYFNLFQPFNTPYLSLKQISPK